MLLTGVILGFGFKSNRQDNDEFKSNTAFYW